jgi:hypothetical protein
MVMMWRNKCQYIVFLDFINNFYDLQILIWCHTFKFGLYLSVTTKEDHGNLSQKKNAIFWDVMPLALLRTNILKECIASIIRAKRTGELGETVATCFGC